LFQPEQQTHCPEIGADIEQVFRRNLAEHHAMPDASLGQSRNHPRKLSDLDPRNFIHERGQLGIRFALECDSYESFNSHTSGLAGKHQRQRPASGDDTARLDGLAHERKV
jgi:hypothetical protein